MCVLSASSALDNVSWGLLKLFVKNVFELCNLLLEFIIASFTNLKTITLSWIYCTVDTLFNLWAPNPTFEENILDKTEISAWTIW